MVAAVVGRLLAEYDRQLRHTIRLLVQLHPRDGRAVAALARLGEGDIDVPVGCEIRIDRNIEQAALVAGGDRGQACERSRYGAVRGHHAQPARPFRHQHPPIRQEGEAPRIFETLRHRLHDDGGFLGLERLGLRERGGCSERDGEGEADGGHTGILHAVERAGNCGGFRMTEMTIASAARLP
jgi:hypothetical protein